MATFCLICNSNKTVFKKLPINVKNVIDENGKENTVCDYVTCIVPIDSQEQLFKSKAVIILTKFNVAKECNVIRRGFVLSTPPKKSKC